MCTGAEVAVIVGGGQVLGGLSARSQGRKQSRIYNKQAAQERQISKMNEEDFRRQQELTLAEFHAAGGGSGVDLSTGTPLLAYSDFAAETELQAQKIRAGGEMRATRLDQAASLSKKAGNAAFTDSLFRGGASLLMGFGGFNDKPKQYWT